ncbi:MAG: hypothetical protein ACP6IY_06320, partial [Promethearchaeia archaeon]
MKSKKIIISLIFIILAINIHLKTNNTIDMGERNIDIDKNKSIDEIEALRPSLTHTFKGQGHSQNISLLMIRDQSFINNNTNDGNIIVENTISGWNLTSFSLNFTKLYTTGKYEAFEIRNDGTDTFTLPETYYALSFKIPNSCYLKNISTFLQYWGGNATFQQAQSSFSIRIYNATYNVNRIIPDSPLDNENSDEIIFNLTNKDINQPARWYQANYSNILLNISKTYNNTFFAVFRAIQAPTYGNYYFYYANEQSDDKYDIIFYKKVQIGSWTEITGKNGLLKVNLDPISYTPTASQINLTVFGKQVSDNGYYVNNTFFPNQYDEFKIPITSPWFANVKYNVSFRGHFIYNSKSIVNYNATIENGIFWNASLSINQFPTDSYNRTARFYKPEYWIYNSTYNNTQKYSDSKVDAKSKYIDIVNATNSRWSIIFKQNSAVKNFIVQKSSDKKSWKSFIKFTNITDFINTTINLNHTNGKALLYIYSQKLEMTLSTNITDSLVKFPIWRPDQNTSVISNNTKLELIAYTNNGSIIGLNNISFNVILSNLNITLINKDSTIKKDELAYYYFNIENEYNNEKIEINDVLIQVKKTGETWKALEKHVDFKIIKVDLGKYNITIDTSRDKIVAGNYLINFTFSSTYFFDKMYSSELNVSHRTLNMTIKGANEPDRIYELGDYAVYYLYLNDSITGEGVSNLDFSIWANFSATNGGRQEISQLAYNIKDYRNGTYDITILTEIMYSGKKTLDNVTIEFYAQLTGKYSIVNKNDTLKIYNPVHKTELIILANTSTTIAYGDDAWICLQFKDLTTNRNLTNAYFIIKNNSIDLPTSAYTVREFPNKYNITFNLEHLEPGIYKLEIIAHKPREYNITYQDASVIYNFSLLLYPSELTIPSEYQNLIIYQEQALEMIVIAKDSFRKRDILNATIIMKISGTSLISEKFKALASNFGWYSGIIKIGNLEPGKYLIEINMSAPNYLNAQKNTTLTVLERKETKISLVSELKDSYTWGDTLTIEILLKEGDNPMPDKIIQFKITEIYPDGTIKNKYFSSTTNKDGIAKINYVVEDIKSLEIEVIFNGTAEFKPITLTQKNIEVHSQLEQIIITLIPFSPFIIGAIIGLSGYVIVKKSKQKKLQAEWREKTNKFFDTLNIEYFLIIHKISALAIVQKELGQITFDGDLIGGFLQAISTFKYELKGERATLDKKESILLDYQDYKIL